MWAPSWGWIDAANIVLGANQAFAWSMTVIMKVDLVGPQPPGTGAGPERVRRLPLGGAVGLGQRGDGQPVRAPARALL